MISLRAAEPRHRRCPGSPQTRRPERGRGGEFLCCGAHVHDLSGAYLARV